MEKENAIEVAHVQKRFGDRVVVHDVSFAVRQGEVFGLLGPNGAGKTTTLKMITTLLRQDGGHITVNGFDTLTQPQMVRRQFGLTGQTATIDQDLTATENLVIFARLNGLSRSAARARAAELLASFDLTNAANQRLSEFSGGMRRRLDLAVSLIGAPSILFLDEPTTGLDPRTRAQMWATIRDLVQQGSTVVLTTQYLEEADQLADRIALIDHGRMVAVGTPSQLKQQIGGSRLSLEVPAASWTTPAQAVVQKVLSGPVMVEKRTVTADLGPDGLPAVNTILQQLQAAGVPLSNFAMQEPSLDDVFLRMTVGKN
ncbi:ATP-binding cassette domain-containing protein [Lacticaseibacillus thailandensis]|uniref:Abc transporteratp-binding protein n=1 Tax=Lacticaseibacillus thailandensis DSM 22698 = JCM 13996 TaxID=1423810 RepID=A0A0R2C6B6_9LACO|nr:ATP-binding cassette domain-containing protein [Lacticaseibacillus thailandensis]KRM87230.1 abc transporteratp-binding protein [Lacticaseibacillus thailandensis DSM 22698 = JCM 13996]